MDIQKSVLQAPYTRFGKSVQQPVYNDEPEGLAFLLDKLNRLMFIPGILDVPVRQAAMNPAKSLPSLPPYQRLNVLM